MTTLGNIELIKNGIFNSGVAFELNKPSSVDEIIKFDDGWQAEIRSGIQYLVVRGSRPKSTVDDIYPICYEYAQQFLDLLSVCKITQLRLSNYRDSFLVWWMDNNGQNLQIRSLWCEKIGVKSAVYDEHGLHINSIKASGYHPSYRYFRLSKESEDLFESFRNMYLAFENLLHDFTPKNEGEGAWFKRGLKELEEIHNVRISQIFTRFQPPKPDDEGKEILSELIHKELYKNVRCKIFHFKEEDSCLIPGRLEDQEIVAWALHEITQIFIAMAINKKHIIPRGSFRGSSEFLANQVNSLIPDEMSLSFSQEDPEKIKLSLSVDPVTNFPDIIVSALINSPSLNLPTRILEFKWTELGPLSHYHVNFFDATLVIDGIDILEFRYRFSAKNPD
jgi:hypothetical protein